MNDLLPILEKLKFPFEEQINHYPLLLLSEQGEILSHWNLQNEAIRPTMAQAILKTKSIFEIFSIPKCSSLSSFDFFQKPALFFAFQHSFKFDQSPFSFFTTLPVLSLTINPAGPYQYLGVLNQIDRLDTLNAQAYGGVLFIDSKTDNIVGINSSFYSYFKNQFSSAFEMLNLNASLFFSPGPKEYQQKRISSNALSSNNRSLFADATSLSPAYVKNPETLAITRNNASTTIINNSNHLQTIELTTPLKWFECGYQIELTFEGNDVLLMAGHTNNPLVLPDHLGYCIGKSPDTNAPFLKRAGHRTRTSDGSSAPFSEWTIEFHDGVIQLYENKTLLFEYADYHPPENPSWSFFLAFRAHSKTVLRQWKVFEEPLKTKQESMEWVVQLNTPEQQDFLVRHLYFPISPNLRIDVEGFAFVNISDLIRKNRELQKRLARFESSSQSFIGKSPAIVRLRELSETAARHSAPLLIEGATGTGKEVLAHYLHDISKRNGDFVKVDCTTLPPSLFESELFGVEKGAFTGATDARKGKFESAHKGTLFLDEVSNLSLTAQAKLLSFCQDFTVTRVGGTVPKKLDIRLIAASNVPLTERIRKGLFREDLYYRLNTFLFQLPPLHERKEDLPELVNYFIELTAKELGKAAPTLSVDALRFLSQHRWPGNIRELKSTLDRAVTFSNESVLTVKDFELPITPTSTKPEKNPLRIPVSDMESLLTQHKGNIRRVAESLGVARGTVYTFLLKNNVNLKVHRNQFFNAKEQGF